MERLLQLKIQGGPTNNAAALLYVEQQQREQNVEQGGGGSGSDGDLGCGYGRFLLNTQQEQEEKQQTSPATFAFTSLLGKMSFLEMLQSMESPPLSPPHPSTQSTSCLQKQQQNKNYTTNMETLESCISHEICEEEEEAHSRVKYQSHPAVIWRCSNVDTSISGSGSEERLRPQVCNNTVRSKEDKIRKKRKRTTTEATRARASKKNKQEMESQRMTHITVERNRRRQMNYNLNALRSLMPPALVQKGDQASIIGGAIDFVKELEQLLQSLEAQKRMCASTFSCSGATTTFSSSCNDNTKMTTIESPQQEEENGKEIRRRRSVFISGLLTSPPREQHNNMMNDIIVNKNIKYESESSSGNRQKRKEIEIQVMVIESHVNLKMICPKRQGQLLRAIAAFEGIGLTFLHLNVNSFDSNSVLYSFNLKIEDGCEFRSGDEIAAVVHRIFSYINNDNNIGTGPGSLSRAEQSRAYEPRIVKKKIDKIKSDLKVGTLII